MGLTKTFLAIGIAIVFAAFVIYGLKVVYEPPKYEYPENDCYLQYDCYKPIRECENKYYNASNPTLRELPNEARECSINITQSAEFKQCQKASDACNEEFQKKSLQYKHAKNTFLILLIIGLGAILAGSRMPLEGISSGFIGGGVILILWSLVNSWMYLYHLDRYLKLAGLGIALALLVYIAYKRTDSKKK